MHQVPHIDGALIFRLKTVVGAQALADTVHYRFVIAAFVLHEDAVEIVGVGEVIHGGKRHQHSIVVAVIATAIGFALEHADHLIRETINVNFFSYRGPARKKFAANVGAYHRYAGVGHLVFLIEHAPIVGIHVANLQERGIDAIHWRLQAADVVADGGVIFFHERRNAL